MPFVKFYEMAWNIFITKQGFLSGVWDPAWALLHLQSFCVVFCDFFSPLLPPQTGSLDENLRFLNSLVSHRGSLEEQLYSVA